MTTATVVDLGGVLQISAGGFGVFVVLDSDMIELLGAVVDRYRKDAELGPPENDE